MTNHETATIMSAMTGRTGRPISFWMSHEEIDALQAAADKDGCTRNEAARRAVRDFAKKLTA